MGFWRSARGINGDQWADEMDRVIDRLAAMTVADSKLYGSESHEITLGELADLIEFCTRGQIVASVRDPALEELPLSGLRGNSVETISNRGQIHCSDTCDSRVPAEILGC